MSDLSLFIKLSPIEIFCISFTGERCLCLSKWSVSAPVAVEPEACLAWAVFCPAASVHIQIPVVHWTGASCSGSVVGGLPFPAASPHSPASINERDPPIPPTGLGNVTPRQSVSPPASPHQAALEEWCNEGKIYGHSGRSGVGSVRASIAAGLKGLYMDITLHHMSRRH